MAIAVRGSGWDPFTTLVRQLDGDFDAMMRRAFALPEHVTADAVEAEYVNGLLKVRVRDIAKPKVEPRKIAIRGSAGPAQPDAVEGAAPEAS